jgi:hypothetical protein
MQPNLLVMPGSIKMYANIVSVDEGHFNGQEEFVADRRRNGDEVGRRGLWVEPNIGVLRVITCD